MWDLPLKAKRIFKLSSKVCIVYIINGYIKWIYLNAACYSGNTCNYTNNLLSHMFKQNKEGTTQLMC